MNTSREAEILCRVIDHQPPEFCRHFAGAVLALDFPPEDRQTMAQLAEKVRREVLSSEEQEEIDRYERVGHFLSAMKSTARRALQRHVS